MADWRSLCAHPHLRFDGDEVIVVFENGREHRVRVRETDDVFEVHAVVARAGVVARIPDLPFRVWLHNRNTQLVSFRIDNRGRVYSEGWIPKAGVTAEEFQLVLRRVAAESDRLEFVLTGKDLE
jgi:hypothetical protein